MAGRVQQDSFIDDAESWYDGLFPSIPFRLKILQGYRLSC